MDGKQLQEWRQARKLGVRHVATALGVSRRTVETWETTGIIPEKKRQRVRELVEEGKIPIRVSHDVLLNLEKRASEKQFPSADAYAAAVLAAV